MMIKLIATAALIYVGYCGLMFLFQRHMIFPRYLVRGAQLPQPPDGAQVVAVPAADGPVNCWYFQAGAEPAPLLIYAHGNAELIDDCVADISGARDRGVHVLLVEYPGYGANPGAPSQKSITAVLTQAYDMVTDRPEVQRNQIIMVGRSIGGGAICCLAAQRPACGLILLSTFTSIRSFARRYLAPPWLIRDPMDNLAVVAGFNGPVVIAHGRHDSVIAYAHAPALHAAAQRGKLLSYAADHNDCPPDWEAFWRDAFDYLAQTKALLPLNR